MTAEPVPAMRARVSCSACGCEIGFGHTPETNIAHSYEEHEERGRRTHGPIDGEPPLNFDRACPCRCHAAWHAWFDAGVAT